MWGGKNKTKVQNRKWGIVVFGGIFCENKRWIVVELNKVQSWSKAVNPSQAPVAFPHNGSIPDSWYIIPASLFSCQSLWLILSIQLTGVRRLETELNFKRYIWMRLTFVFLDSFVCILNYERVLFKQGMLKYNKAHLLQRKAMLYSWCFRYAL